MSASEAAPAPAGVASLPASIPLRRDVAADAPGPFGEAAWLVIAGAMILVAIAMFIARRRIAKTRGPWGSRLRSLLDAAQPAEIERVSSTRLSPRHSLHVVVWNGRRLLVGCTDQSMQLLAEAPAGAGPMPEEKA